MVNSNETVPPDPTAGVNLDFAAYIQQQQDSLDRHIKKGVPDYAFPLDAVIRSKLTTISLLRTIGQAVSSATVPYQRQLHLMNGVAVGPQQFPDIHQMGEDCARILGIGIPQIFIISGPIPNGWTYCTSDADQIIILTNSLVQACNAEELKFIIGHECGHIHNQHIAYNTIWELIANPLAQSVLLDVVKDVPGVGAIFPLLQMAAKASLWYVFNRWHRCAEITSDRAGLICCGNTAAALRAHGKLMTGGADLLQGFNAEEYSNQISKINESPLRFLEIFQSHPVGAKRVEALRLFSECKVLYDWRPEMRRDITLRGKADIDAECENLLK